MYVQRHRVTVVTAADGTATAYTPVVNGRLLGIIYTKVDYPDTVDFAITAETTLQNLWTQANRTASQAVAPRQPTCDNAAAASLYAAGGEPVEDYYFLGNERVKIVLAGGGDTKSGIFDVLVG